MTTESAPSSAPAPAEVPQESAEVPATAVPVPEVPQDLGKQFGALARQRKRDELSRSELQKARDQHAAEMAELKKYNELKAKAKQDPKAWFEHTGLTLDDIVNDYIKETAPPTEQQRIEALERTVSEYRENVQKAAKHREEMATAEAEKAARANVARLVSEASERYELINAKGVHDEVFDLIMRNFRETGKDNMSVERAADLLEEQLFEEQKELAGKAKKKLAPLFASSPEAGTEAKAGTKDTDTTAPEGSGARITRTLTNGVTPARSMAANREWDRRASLKRLAEALKYKD